MSSSNEPSWRLRVRNAVGQVESLELSGLSEAQAIRHVLARGGRVLAMEPLSPAAASVARTSRFPLLLFSQEMLALLQAGLNLTEVLATLQAKERQLAVQAVIADLLRLLREGQAFSDVLAARPEHFPDIYVAAIRASERTGDMPQTLSRYIAYQLQFEGIRKKLVSAAIYPVMLLVVGGFVTLFLLGYVVPKFATVYESSGRDMPWLSSILLAFGKLMAEHWQWALGILVASIGATGWAVSRQQSRAWLLRQGLKLPWLSEQAAQFRMARFYRAVSMLLASGIALPRAMAMVTDLLSDAQRLAMARARLAIEQGQSLSQALTLAGLDSPVADSLIKVGERSGQMAEMLERIARFQDEDFARWVDWTSKLLEPVLMAVIGLVIGMVVVLMYMPIFDLAGSLQ
jgi:general secretion pathway protein F